MPDNQIISAGRAPDVESIRRKWHDELFFWLRHRATGFTNSPEYLRRKGPEEEDRDGVLIGYWSEEETP